MTLMKGQSKTRYKNNGVDTEGCDKGLGPYCITEKTYGPVCKDKHILDD